MQPGVECSVCQKKQVDKNEAKKVDWGQTVDDLEHQARLFRHDFADSGKLWKGSEQESDLIKTVLQGD